MGSEKRDTADIVPDSDLANARRFIKYFGEDLRYVPESGWYHWNGVVWRNSADLIAAEFAKDTALMVVEEALTCKAQLRKTMFQWAKISQGAQRLRATISVASSDDQMRFPVAAFDSDPWLFNCQNGAVNLKNGMITGHDRLKYCTRVSPARYGDALTDDSLWLTFLRDITAGNKELEGYLQRVAGYCLTGSIAEKCFFFCYGSGDNGKSVFIEVLHELLGNYSLALNTQTLIKQRYGNNGIPNDIARLCGPRLATTSETSKGEEWNDTLIKDLTGGDIITARFLKKEFFDFRPQCKLIIRGNNKPEVTDHSAGMWRRIQLIPFDVQISSDKQDKDLRDKIVRRELSGVLTWALEGCLEWQKVGLSPPESIISAVKEYREEMDIVGSFLHERVLSGGNVPGDTKASILYGTYKEWCSDNGYKASNPTAFGLEMGQRNYSKVRKADGNYYTHIIVKDCENTQEGDVS